MQGTAADIIKKAMILVDNWIEAEGNGQVNLLMQVHDELVFEVKEDALEDVTKQVTALMESAVELDVPLIADSDFGNNWDEAH